MKKRGQKVKEQMGENRQEICFPLLYLLFQVIYIKFKIVSALPKYLFRNCLFVCKKDRKVGVEV